MNKLGVLDEDFKASINALIQQKSVGTRERIWGRTTLFWSMIGQALECNATCTTAVKTLQATGRKCSSNTAAFCKARAKFPMELLDQILPLTTGVTVSALLPLRRVLHIDGVAFTLADTAANRAQYDMPSGQAEGCGFPVMGALAIRSAATGALLALFPSNWKTHDFRLFISSISFFQAGDIIVGDRAFCAYAAFAWQRIMGADMVCRLHQRRKFDPSKAIRNAHGDWTVVWKKGVYGKKSPIPEALFKELPEELTLRIVKSIEERKGFRSKEIFIVTTLLDIKLYPANIIRNLYLERWEIEESFRDFKDSMNYGFIRSRSPESVMKTLKTGMIAHNLTRVLGGAALQRHKVRGKQISFKGAVKSVRLFLVHRLVCNKPLGIGNFKRLLVAIATDLVKERPERREPRAVKRRPKPYPLLTCNRHLYQEIPHKGRYKKSAKSA